MRRLRRIMFTPDFIADFFKGCDLQSCDWIPLDAVLVRADYDRNVDRFAMVFEHPDFDYVPEGSEIPEHVMVYSRRIP